jgi:hypothetical protein
MESKIDSSDPRRLALKHTNNVEDYVRDKYKKRAPLHEARNDAKLLLSTRLRWHQLETILPNTPSCDLEIAHHNVILYSGFLSAAQEDKWEGIKKYFQKEARYSFESAAFSAKYCEKNRSLADEEEAKYWLNLANSL